VSLKKGIFSFSVETWQIELILVPGIQISFTKSFKTEHMLLNERSYKDTLQKIDI